MKTAEACIRLLQERFGARRVILFGSLAGQGIWLAGRAQPPTRTELRAIAGILHEFYNGVERILERIALGIGEGLPRGGHWHADLLAQMAIAREGKRSAVIDELLYARLKDYLDFRHFIRHAYGYTLQWNQIHWKAEHLAETLVMFYDQIHAFFKVKAGLVTLLSPAEGPGDPGK